MRLAPDEVLVWSMEVATPTDATVARWRSLLSTDERARADRHRVPEARVTYIAAHALARSLLSHAGSRPPWEWRFSVGNGGKPEVDPSLGSKLRFNLSHTFGLVAGAVCVEDDVGIDVEAFDRRTSDLRVADRFFCSTEAEIVRSNPDDVRRESFLRMWTLKESYIKATGEGFRRSLQSFCFSLDPVTITFTGEPADDPADWQFFEERPTPRHSLSVSLHRPILSAAQFIWLPLTPDAL